MITDAPGWRRCKTIMPANATVISIDKACPRRRPEPSPLATMTVTPTSAKTEATRVRAETRSPLIRKPIAAATKGIVA
jgi:hypothetical protein